MIKPLAMRQNPKVEFRYMLCNGREDRIESFSREANLFHPTILVPASSVLHYYFFKENACEDSLLNS